MKNKDCTELNKALEEAFKYGFNNRFHRENNVAHFIGEDTEFSTTDYAVLKTIPVQSARGFKGELSYVVLNDGTLGIFLEAESEKNKIGLSDSREEKERVEDESLVYHNDFFLF